MGRYMRKSTAVGEVALMEVSQSLGVLTRAKTLALQRLQNSAQTAVSGVSYLQLRSRRLEKPPIPVTRDLKRQKHPSKGRFVSGSNRNLSPNSGSNSRSRVASVNSGSVRSVSRDPSIKEEGHLPKDVADAVVSKDKEIQDNSSIDVGAEPSLGENVLDFEGRERSTRESTPCSLVRDPDTIKTPGSTTRSAKQRVRNLVRGHIPTAAEMDEFFAVPEEQQQRQFIEKYNFDPSNDQPLPGRYDWVKLDPDP